MAQALRATTTSPACELLRDSSIEVSSRDVGAVARLAAWFAPGTEMFVNFVPGTDHRRSVDMAAAVRAAGFEPVPHVTARSFSSRAELGEFLARLAGEAGVERLLAIAGDVSVPRGPFASTLDLIRTGLLPEHGIKAVGLAGYPEDHHTLSAQSLSDAAQAKLAAAAEQGLATFLVTQFCFEAAPILDWHAATRRAGIAVPIRIGIAGPASLRALLTFAMKCGVGTSLRVLLNQPQSIGRMLRDASPDDLLRELADGFAGLAPGAAPKLHLFPFGGLEKTAAWRRQLLGGM